MDKKRGPPRVMLKTPTEKEDWEALVLAFLESFSRPLPLEELIAAIKPRSAKFGFETMMLGSDLIENQVRRAITNLQGQSKLIVEGDDFSLRLVNSG